MTTIDQIAMEHLAQYREAADNVAALLEAVHAVTGALIDSLTHGGVIYSCGNGGSAADAQHLTAELIGHYRRDRRPLPAVTLTTDPSVLTCLVNDYSPDLIFARQIEALARPGDVVCGFTTSGRSPNVVAALGVAKEKGATTVLFCGANPGACGAWADLTLAAAAPSTPRVQEIHTLLLHMIADAVDAWAAGELEIT